MSILQNLPPQTQTSEQFPSGETTDVATIRDRLGSEGLQRVVAVGDVLPESETNIIYFPTHDSVQAGIDFLHSVELERIDARLHELSSAIKEIDRDLYRQEERLSAIDGYIDDLGITDDLNVATRLFNGNSRVSTLGVIQALQNMKAKLYGVLEVVKDERRIAVAKIESLEAKDFELLQAGK